ncbi:transcriptional repressor LexA [Aciditerrimonas ferrireducens]|uniref:transcriptional repressor LexA n=1 Tax=Aciditerrimonas ferrireducens TaxID=667306 RepID=UPI0020030AFD|nr:transcriptional repressor LexA [Aciditerrimonas ferrireducens]MCK4177707.1 transcriptional repressor LexA [Aciditerrimonas ferrireducens]
MKGVAPVDEDVELSPRRRQILAFIARCQATRGYPPSVREIGEAVGLCSSASVHGHLTALEAMGYLRRDPSKPRAIELRRLPDLEDGHGGPVEAGTSLGAGAGTVGSGAGYGLGEAIGALRAVPVVGQVAAGTGVLADELVEDVLPLPANLVGQGTVFGLRVRGDSMIEAGILDGDVVVVRQQPTADPGDVVVAGLPGEEATVKTFRRRGRAVVLEPANPRYEPIVLDAAEVVLYGKVVSLLRQF